MIITFIQNVIFPECRLENKFLGSYQLENVQILSGNFSLPALTFPKLSASLTNSTMGQIA